MPLELSRTLPEMRSMLTLRRLGQFVKWITKEGHSRLCVQVTVVADLKGNENPLVPFEWPVGVKHMVRAASDCLQCDGLVVANLSVKTCQGMSRLFKTHPENYSLSEVLDSTREVFRLDTAILVPDRGAPAWSCRVFPLFIRIMVLCEKDAPSLFLSCMNSDFWTNEWWKSLSPGWGCYCKGCISFGLRSCCLCFCLFHAWKGRAEKKDLQWPSKYGRQLGNSIQHCNTRRRWQENNLWIAYVVPNQVLSPECLFTDAPEGSAKIAHRHVTVVTSFTYSMAKTRIAWTWSHGGTRTAATLFYTVSTTHTVEVLQSGAISKRVNMFDPFRVLKPGSQVAHHLCCLN